MIECRSDLPDPRRVPDWIQTVTCHNQQTIMTLINEYNQPVGHAVLEWEPCKPPPGSTLTGNLVILERLDVDKHGDQLFQAFGVNNKHLWTYMFTGPFDSESQFLNWLSSVETGTDPLFYSVIDKTTGKAVGLFSFMRIQPAVGVIEVGNITYSPLLQRTTLATETMLLLGNHVFDELGYRRFEWKCDSLNAPSRRAAERYGFSYDGLFRQAIIYKGRNRDTAWYSILDNDWPTIASAYQAWLEPGNFHANGQQKTSFASFMEKARGS